MSQLVTRFAIRRGDFHLDVHLDLPAKGVSVIFGPSGSGKTTYLRCLAGLLRSPSGYMKLNDTVWQDESQNRFLPVHRRPIGMVFQDARLFPHLNVRSNLEFGYRRTALADRKISLEKIVDLLGLEPLLERRPGALSAGEQQRVSLGRALLTSPRLLLMDEPLANLDARRKLEILPFLLRLRSELSLPIVYVSHSLQEVLQLVDTLVLLEEGRVVASGEANTVLSRLDLGLKMGPSLTGAVLETRVAEVDESFGLMRVQFKNRSLYLPRHEVAVGQTLRLHIRAQDVSLVLGTAAIKTSVLNILPARVLEIGEIHTEGYSVNIKLDIGVPLVATITRKSLAHLDLKPGQEVFAHIKAVKMVQEMDEF